ncbi:MAG: hypothetical protein NT157_02725 [Candidatus Micrarchaeota archaeon]|nr:hypothetical protein [Candidatus Micrarchaeota archaeon]
MKRAEEIKKELEGLSAEITRLAGEAGKRDAGEIWSGILEKTEDMVDLAEELLELEPDTEFEPAEPDVSGFTNYLAENAKIIEGGKETMLLVDGVAIKVPTAGNEMIVEKFRELARQIREDEEDAELVAFDLIEYVQAGGEFEPLQRAYVSASLAMYEGEIGVSEGLLVQTAVCSKLGEAAGAQ